MLWGKGTYHLSWSLYATVVRCGQSQNGMRDARRTRANRVCIYEGYGQSQNGLRDARRTAQTGYAYMKLDYNGDGVCVHEA